MSRSSIRYGRALAALVLATACFAATAQARPSAAVTTAAVTRETLSETVTAYGTIQPDPDSVTAVTLPRAGIISRLLVRLGQRVRRGESLLVVDTAPAERMNYLQAQAAVDFARSDLQRLQELHGQQMATNSQIAAARKNLRDAEARLQSLKQVGANQHREVMRAPYSGIVTQLSVSEGQRVQANTSALLIAGEQHLIIQLGLEPEDARRVEPGQAVELTSLFDERLRIQSQVRQIHAMINPTTRLVDVLVPVPAEASAEFVLGSMMRGEIRVAHQQALVVPRSAVLRDDGGAYVFVVRDGKASRVEVRTGLEEGQRVAVEGALDAGAQVVTLGNYELEDGMAVRVGPGP